MRDLNNIKDKWKVYYEEKINSSVDSLWDLISSPSNLEIFHPFCKSNKIIKWPGEHSIDELNMNVKNIIENDKIHSNELINNINLELRALSKVIEKLNK